MMKRTSIVLLASVFVTLLISGCSRSLFRQELRLGVKAAEKDLWDEALVRGEKAVALAPRSAAAHNNLAVAYEKLARWEDARREYEAALGIDPDNADIKLNYDRFQRNQDAWKDDADKDGNEKGAAR